MVMKSHVPVSAANSKPWLFANSNGSSLCFPSSPHLSLCTVTPSISANLLKSGFRQRTLLFNTMQLLPWTD